MCGTAGQCVLTHPLSLHLSCPKTRLSRLWAVVSHRIGYVAVLGVCASHLRRRSLDNANQGLMVSSECPAWQRSLAPPHLPHLFQALKSPEVTHYPGHLKVSKRTSGHGSETTGSGHQRFGAKSGFGLEIFLLDQDLILSSDPDPTLFEPIIMDPKRI